MNWSQPGPVRVSLVLEWFCLMDDGEIQQMIYSRVFEWPDGGQKGGIKSQGVLSVEMSLCRREIEFEEGSS